MSRFYEEWLQEQIHEETGAIRLELLQKGLGHGTREFLRTVWFPAIGYFNHLFPEWEVRDFNNGYRYLDLAYMPGGAKGGIEIQGFGPHARMSEDSKTCADGIVYSHWMAFSPRTTQNRP